MIGRKSKRKDLIEEPKPLGFDDFELRLGDVMRGERATLGKSLLDVQRELRIRASYIAAIENCDPSAFDTPGFIAGYVRSYARYLDMDPDATFAAFCAESGFVTAHGMSEKASVIKKRSDFAQAPKAARDPFSQPNMPFAPGGDSFLSQIEPGAIGSMLVLVALLGGIGFGGWTVLKEVQRVQLAPVEQTPVVLSDLDPLDAAVQPVRTDDDGGADIAAVGAGPFSPPSNEALDRLYRPQALDVPVLIARDAPISTLDPRSVGAFAQADRTDLPEVQGDVIQDGVDRALAEALGDVPAFPRVLEDMAPGVIMVAVRPAWVRVRASDGTTIFEAIMNAGDTYAVPQTEDPATLRVGESGAIYFAVNGQTYGPAGARGQVTSNLPLSVANLTATYTIAAAEDDTDLARVVAELNNSDLPAE